MRGNCQLRRSTMSGRRCIAIARYARVDPSLQLTLGVGVPAQALLGRLLSLKHHVKFTDTPETHTRIIHAYLNMFKILKIV